jgi:hypothetical protein
MRSMSASRTPFTGNIRSLGEGTICVATEYCLTRRRLWEARFGEKQLVKQRSTEDICAKLICYCVVRYDFIDTVLATRCPNAVMENV